MQLCFFFVFGKCYSIPSEKEPFCCCWANVFLAQTWHEGECKEKNTDSISVTFSIIIASSCLTLLHATSTSSCYTFISCRPTRVQRAQWSIGSSGLCCLAWTCGSPSTLHSGSPRTYCQCSLWLAANWEDEKKKKNTPHPVEKRGGNWIIKNIWSFGNVQLCKCLSGKDPDYATTPHQLLLSTASPNPGVSTMVSVSWTPPSLISTLDCSTWNTPTLTLFSTLLTSTHAKS